MLRPIRAAIVDDERLARERVSRLLAAHPDFIVDALCADGDSAVEVLAGERPDVVFLDVQMPGRDGLAVAAALLERMGPEAMPIVVFVTAYDEHAIRAFDAQAIDYVLKPFDDERFDATLERVRRRVRHARLGAAAEQIGALLGAPARGGPNAAPAAPAAGAGENAAAAEQTAGRLERLVLRTGNSTRLVRAEEVDWIEAAGVYVRLHIGSERFLLRTPMHELEVRLDPRRFARVHRSTIVNLDRVRELRSGDRAECFVVLHDGSRHRLSRTRKAQLEALLGQSL